jgi:hypothetical protein
VRKVRREDLVDYLTYQERRETERPRAMAEKERRRIHVGPHLTFLFENADTTRYQIQEMMLAERLVREADIRHELETYNEILGGPGELGATLLIEIESPAERDEKLRRWLDLPQRIYARLEDRSLVRPSFDPRQVSDGRLSSVHYLKFETGGRVPVSLGCDLPEMVVETPLTPRQLQALAEDLAG